jgi:signal transduction histidine kinase
MAVMEEELLELRDQSDADAELVQLGTAILVINHEFNQTVSSVRRSVRRLKPWADANPNLGQLYRELRASFEHLDGYLTLFTPLQRRLYRKAVSMTGGEIHKYLRSLFAERLRREEVTLVATPAFRRGQIVGYPSTFYPVFVNLVDNALFWLRDVQGERTIRLDFDNGAFLIEDTGPGIAERDREIIFEQGFTRKPRGRGLGLYVSRSVLEKAGYKLEVQPEYEADGACFRISPIESDS